MKRQQKRGMVNEIEKNNDEIIIYQSEGGKIRFDVGLENKMVWLAINQMAELYCKARSIINEHILNACMKGEIDEAKAIRKVGNSDFPWGRISYEEVMEKALAEYWKYPVKTLSPVEHAHLEFFKLKEKKIMGIK